MPPVEPASRDQDVARLERLLADVVKVTRVPSNDGRARQSPRADLAEACAIARRLNVHPEQVIIMLKQAWMNASMSDGAIFDDVQASLDRAVTMCIEQYFADAPLR